MVAIESPAAYEAVADFYLRRGAYVAAVNRAKMHLRNTTARPNQRCRS